MRLLSGMLDTCLTIMNASYQLHWQQYFILFIVCTVCKLQIKNFQKTHRSFLTSGESNLRPIYRLVAYSVFCGLVTAWRLAGAPTSLSPSGVNATTEGVVRLPSAFSRTFAVLPSMTATQELVVPKSIPHTAPRTPSEL